MKQKLNIYVLFQIVIDFLIEIFERNNKNIDKLDNKNLKLL